MARATLAQGPLRGAPWVLKYPYCHKMITQPHPRGNTRVLEKSNSEIFSGAIKTTAGSVLTGKGPYGGGGVLGVPRVGTPDPGTPPWVHARHAV